MAEKDILENSLCRYNDVFADIVNNLVFGGRQRIKEEDLKPAAERQVYQGEKAFRELERDVTKYWQENTISVALLGLENQTVAEDDMPIRVIGYDGASYRDQICYETDEKGKRKKSRKRYPVITLVLYFGYEHRWDKARTLHEALGDALSDELKAFVPEYPINIYEIAYLTDEQLAGFKSDFRFVADYFVQMQRTGTYVGSKEEMKHVREVLQLMATLLGNNKFTEIMEDKSFIEEKGGKVTMIDIFDVYEKRGETRGEDRHLIEQICKKLHRGKDVEQIADEVEEDITRVEMICNIAERFAPEYDTDKVFAAVEKELLAVDV